MVLTLSLQLISGQFLLTNASSMPTVEIEVLCVCVCVCVCMCVCVYVCVCVLMVDSHS